MTVSSRIIVSTVIVLVVLTVQSAAAQQAPVPPRGNQPTNANEPRATNGTVYTNKTELFATFRPPFIVGQATRIGAHLSKLGCPENDRAVARSIKGRDTREAKAPEETPVSLN